MSKRQKKLDPNQLSFSFNQRIHEYTRLKKEILTCQDQPPKIMGSEEELCVEIAAAIKRATGSLEPLQALAEAEGAKVISKHEVRELALGKVDETIIQLQKLKKELRGR